MLKISDFYQEEGETNRNCAHSNISHVKLHNRPTSKKFSCRLMKKIVFFQDPKVDQNADLLIMEESPAVPKDVSLPTGIASSDGGRPPPSPLSGGYLLIVISEPQTDAHKSVILQKLTKGKCRTFNFFLNSLHVSTEHTCAVRKLLSLNGNVKRVH